jgi:chitin disaccharide deacetylase
VSSLLAAETQSPNQTANIGALIVNADDWGRDAATTDRIRECFDAHAISSASAMVFMADSERAAGIAQQRSLDCGLHLNFTTPFSRPNCPPRLAERQQKITRYLRSSRLAQVCFHPGLADSFRHVVEAQVEEFQRIYGREPGRIDGHHHMHLAANVLFAGLLPANTIVRRNFSFLPGQKSWANRRYRKFLDDRLQSRHRLTDFFFSLPPLEPASRLQQIFSLARASVVELETHPVNLAEYQFLTGGEIFHTLGSVLGGLSIASRYRIAKLEAHSASPGS